MADEEVVTTTSALLSAGAATTAFAWRNNHDLQFLHFSSPTYPMPTDSAVSAPSTERAMGPRRCRLRLSEQFS